MRWDANDIFPPACHRDRPVRTIIGIAGPAGAGKSTLARHMALRHGFTVVSLAEPMKHMMEALLDYQDPDQPWHQWLRTSLKSEPCDAIDGHTMRHALQTLGTEWGRNIMGEDFWVNTARRRIESIPGNVVIDDIRFDNETALCDRVIQMTGRGGIDCNHASENGVSKWDVQYQNDGSVAEMRKWFDYVSDIIIRKP